LGRDILSEGGRAPPQRTGVLRLVFQFGGDQFDVLPPAQADNDSRGQAVANALMLKAELDPDAPRSAPRSMIQRFADLSDFVAG